ncbi:N-acetyl-gamma-glutamyl-phosphate reductase [Pseudomonas syringae]|uniref:N-acetyl-gamma-glutamyl-phosphate reductase n=1 Tax=Pseudomonas syringae pv. papulans TaxID=83963 RepID=A0A0P9XT33_PSESX|nr:N-acetyl-gamma-glutamyl-phosphate reductase [Pseudomonas syringae]KPY23108.1 N-acetyl-gamma-glutamyl-phosphate reductase [Pseudomonas syringae pv. papulans]KWS39556.1 hypothetical protein AL059_25310 [Pseudomonas syringae pv. papulans]MDH4606642.1 N-acetyl-gamma-glutamyl-phosphate reductase [Pseudomonas syringae pv. papulans]MDH4623288.1 N-acetyl-gamma-glutamyl-phosphate reductase [Pseudomonas syringae pv. papulans]RMN50737.1 N-acetyl-gamma-glutamyl-phosphate reductase [Pseudomonas syringae
MTLKAVVIGATGWTGAEIIRLLDMHPQVEDIHAVSREPDISLESIHPNLTGINKKTLQLNQLNDVEADCAFISLPSGAAHDVALQLSKTRTRIIDLGADFRFSAPRQFETIYGKPHGAPALQSQFTYGYVEEYKDRISDSRYVANPGCYVNAALCGLVPLIKANMVDTRSIFISAVNGTSGAGNSGMKELLHYNMFANMLAYSLNGHRHTAEIKNIIHATTGADAEVSMVTSHGNFTRGIFMVQAMKLAPGISLDRQKILDYLHTYYQDNPFIFVTGQHQQSKGIEKNYGLYPQLSKVIGSNACHLSVDIVPETRELRIVSVIDNLVKGAAGTAIQNMNIMMGFDQTTGLSSYGL